MNNIEYVLKNFEGYTKENLMKNFCPTDLNSLLEEINCTGAGLDNECKECWNLEVKQNYLCNKGESKMKQFTKEDLRTGDIIVTRGEGNAILIGSGFKRFEYLKSPLVISTLEDYNEDFTTKGENIREYDIMKVYKITKESEFDSLEDLMNELPEGKVELIWKRKREIDWSKVPKWTRVQAKAYASENWRNVYFIDYKEDSNKPYLATVRDEFTHSEGYELEFKYIKIYDESDIKEEWYK